MPTESPLSPTRVRAWLADNWLRVLAHGAGWLTPIGLALDYAAQPDPFTFNRTVMLSTGTGSEVMRRIAAPMVGGMVSATILTLIIFPAVYAVVKEIPLRRALKND